MDVLAVDVPDAAPSDVGAHALSVDAVQRGPAADRERGLTESEADAGLALYGAKELGDDSRPEYARIAARQFTDPLVALLVGAAVVSFAIGQVLEAVAIGVIVLVNGLLGFVQEARAQATRRMVRHDIRHVPVFPDDRLVGIVSGLDLLALLAAERPRKGADDGTGR